MQEKNLRKQTFVDIVQRIKEIENVKKDTVVAEALGLSYKNFHSKKNLHYIPENVVDKLQIYAHKKSIDIDYLLTGQRSNSAGGIFLLTKTDEPLSAREKLYERLLEAKDREIELLKKCHSENDDRGNGETDIDGLGMEIHGNSADPIKIPLSV